MAGTDTSGVVANSAVAGATAGAATGNPYVAGGTMAVGLLQGIMQMEAEKRRLAMEKYQWDQAQKENRFNQEMAMRNQQAMAPVQNAQQNSQSLQGLMSSLGGTRS